MFFSTLFLLPCSKNKDKEKYPPTTAEIIGRFFYNVERERCSPTHSLLPWMVLGLICDVSLTCHHTSENPWMEMNHEISRNISSFPLLLKIYLTFKSHCSVFIFQIFFHSQKLYRIEINGWMAPGILKIMKIKLRRDFEDQKTNKKLISKSKAHDCHLEIWFLSSTQAQWPLQSDDKKQQSVPCTVTTWDGNWSALAYVST